MQKVLLGEAFATSRDSIEDITWPCEDTKSLLKC